MNFNIFKREKAIPIMPEPKFENNWLAKQYEQNVKDGVMVLQKGTPIIIYDDGRGFELACDIKRQFILEYQKQLSERIKIENIGKDKIKIHLSNSF